MTDQVSIREILIPALKAAFPGTGLRLADPHGAVAVFPARSADVGDVSIHDEGFQATIVIGNVTHSHVGPYDCEVGSADHARRVKDEIVEFLEELFADRILLWRGEHAGGWRSGFDGVVPAGLPDEVETFVWSGRIERNG